MDAWGFDRFLRIQITHFNIMMRGFRCVFVVRNMLRERDLDSWWFCPSQILMLLHLADYRKLRYMLIGGNERSNAIIVSINPTWST